MRQSLYELPEGWKYSSLESIAKLVGGATPSKKEEIYWGGSIPWASVRDLNVDNLEKTEFKITEKGLASCSSNIVPNGNLVIATRVGLGKVSRTQVDVAINQDLRGVIPHDNIDVDYLFFWFKQNAEYIESKGTGATVKGVKVDFIKSLKIPLPPLDEQKRIVAKLDALFTRLDAAITDLKETLELSKALFASELGQAVSGNGKEWTFKPLNELGQFCGGGTPSKGKAEYWHGEIPWITPKDMKTRELFDSEMKVTQTGVSNSSAKMLPVNSVLIVARSGILKHTLPVCINRVETTVNQDIKVFIPGKHVTPEYMQYMLKGHESLILSQLVKGGVTVESLKYKEFQAYEFPIPSLEYQNQIVIHLDALAEHTRTLEAETQERLDQLAILKSSLLDSAFRGQL